MNKLAIFALCASAFATAIPEPVDAASGVINRACRASDRPAANRELCGCIQRVANQSLSRTERRTVAKWFEDPHQAQVMRMSSNDSDERLWLRYKAFGQLAKAVCK